MIPTLKEKKRYILFKSLKFIRNEEFFGDMKNMIGEFGIARSGLNLVISKQKKGIIQVAHKFLDEIQVSLLLTDYDVLKVSGVIGKLKGGL